MVQEVQTQWNRYQTPEIIPWVWISERKIKEHTQVVPDMTYSCSGSSWTASWTVSPLNRDVKCYADFSISSREWWVEFCIVDWWIRVPLAWMYEITWNAWWWTSEEEANNHLEVNWKTISTISTLYPWTWDATIRVNLWKFDIIKYNFTLHYDGAYTFSVSAKVNSITIQKL